MSAADQAKMQMMQDLEIEMMSDLYTRMTQACHKKCVPPRYSEPDLGKFFPFSSTNFNGVRLHLSISSTQVKENRFAWIDVWPNI